MNKAVADMNLRQIQRLSQFTIDGIEASYVEYVVLVIVELNILLVSDNHLASCLHQQRYVD